MPSTRSASDQIMYGRAAEQQIIRDLLRRAQRGHGGVMLVDGEPGIGKSLLLRETIGVAAELGFLPAAGAADQFSRAIPFFTFRAAPGEPLTMLTANYPDRDLPDAPVWWISQIQARLDQQAAAVPVLICVDDLDWASPATLAALRTLPRELKRHPVAWILARSNARHRDGEYLFSLLEKDDAVRITLAPLGDDAVAALLTDVFGAPPDASLIALASGAAGNPSLLTELIHGLRDGDAVHVIDDCAVLVSAQLPQRIHQVAQRRLDGLTKSARQLLVTTTVLPPSFRLEDAAEMLGETPAALLPAIEEVMGARLITAGENGFSFRHELLRRAVVDMVPRPAHEALHRQYGKILLSRGESPALIARHLLRAAHSGDARLLADLDRAAAQTMRLWPQIAADVALRALELTPPASPGVLSRSVAAAEALTATGRLDQAALLARDTLARPLPLLAEARLRCAMSTILCARGQSSDAHAEAGKVLAQPQLPDDLRDQAMTAQLQAAVGLRDNVARPTADAILAAPSQYGIHAAVAALVSLAMINWDKGKVGDGLGLLRDASRHGTGISPDVRHFQPLFALAAALVDLRQLREAEDLLRAAGHQPLDSIPAQAVLFILRARIDMANGRLSDAAAAGQAALATAEAVGAHGYTSTAHCVLSLIALRRGDLAAAAHHIASRSAPGPHLADAYARGETTLAQAQISEARDGPAAAIGRIRQICADLPAYPGIVLGDPATPAWLIRTALAAGSDELADVVARTTNALASDNPGFPAITAAAAHSLGLMGQDAAPLAEAAAGHHDPWAKASAAEDLGVLHTRQGERDRAVHHLHAALRGYQLAGGAIDVARIRRRLRTLGVRSRYWTSSNGRPAFGWQSLTDAERAASELVAQGLSNRQVASRMYISPHTVAFYMRQVFRKLDIGSRVELARIVVQQGRYER